MNKEKKTTVILTTHDMGDVDALCKRIVIIDKGKKLYDNDIEHLKRFFGSYRVLKIRLSSGVENDYEIIKNDFSDMSVRQNENWISILVNEEKIKVMDVLEKLQKKYDIHDMQLEEISTEEVIKKIYEGGVKT